jgi:hypothetical protein
MSPTLRVCPCLLLLRILTGCSGQRPTTVSGRVTWEDKPVAKGMIRFQPANGPALMGPIEDGEYEIAGVKPGTFRVAIEALVEVPPKNGWPPPQYEQVLPPQFNQKSTLTAEVVAGRPNELNFDLKP